MKKAIVMGATSGIGREVTVASHIVRAIEKGKEVKVIDWRYAILVALWRLIPRWLWTRLRITS